MFVELLAGFEQLLNSPPQEMLKSGSMKTELRSEEADCGGVGVFGEVGTETDDIDSGSVSAMRWKVILCGGSLSRGTGWPFRVPEVDVRTGRMPGDFRVYAVFLGCRRFVTHFVLSSTLFHF